MEEKVEKAAKKAKKEAPPPKPKLPGEGDPFSPEAEAYSAMIQDPARNPDAYVPRVITGEGVFMPSTYIEDEDEPWHATCHSSNVLGIEKLDATIPKKIQDKIADGTIKAPKPGGDKPGWTGKREIGQTHDNSR